MVFQFSAVMNFRKWVDRYLMVFIVVWFVFVWGIDSISAMFHVGEHASKIVVLAVSFFGVLFVTIGTFVQAFWFVRSKLKIDRFRIRFAHLGRTFDEMFFEQCPTPGYSLEVSLKRYGYGVEDIQQIDLMVYDLSHCYWIHFVNRFHEYNHLIDFNILGYFEKTEISRGPMSNQHVATHTQPKWPERVRILRSDKRLEEHINVILVSKDGNRECFIWYEPEHISIPDGTCSDDCLSPLTNVHKMNYGAFLLKASSECGYHDFLNSKTGVQIEECLAA